MKKTLDGGIYVVVNPQMEETTLLDRLQKLTTQPIAAIQIWDHFDQDLVDLEIIHKIHGICRAASVPLLINNRWEILEEIALDGVHFDEIPEHLNAIRKQIGRPFIVGLTCGNEQNKLGWAAEHADYISFCAMFPSTSAGPCEIVTPETVKVARKVFKRPLFLSGGIKPENMHELKDLEFDGVAVISGLMQAVDPTRELRKYQQQLKRTPCD